MALPLIYLKRRTFLQNLFLQFQSLFETLFRKMFQNWSIKNRHIYLLWIFQIVSRYSLENKILLVVFIEFLVIMVSKVLEKCFRKATMLNFGIRYLIAYFSSAKLNNFGVITGKHYSLKDILPSRNNCCFDKRLTSFSGETTTFKLPVDTRFILQKKYVKFIPFWPSFYGVKFLLIRN